MGLVPRGLGPHDIAASLHIPHNVSQALQIAATAECLPVDLGTLNKKKVTGRLPMLAIQKTYWMTCKYLSILTLITPGLTAVKVAFWCSMPDVADLVFLGWKIFQRKVPVTGVHELGEHWPC